MPECVFCGIVAGTVPAAVIASDEDTVAFRDIAPQAPTHVLVVPRRHIASAAAVSHAEGSLWAALHAMARRVAQAEGLLEGGYRLVVNQGRDAGQAVPHLHLHLLGGRRLRWPPG